MVTTLRSLQIVQKFRRKQVGRTSWQLVLLGGIERRENVGRSRRDQKSRRGNGSISCQWLEGRRWPLLWALRRRSSLLLVFWCNLPVRSVAEGSPLLVPLWRKARQLWRLCRAEPGYSMGIIFRIQVDPTNAKRAATDKPPTTRHGDLRFNGPRVCAKRETLNNSLSFNS